MGSAPSWLIPVEPGNDEGWHKLIMTHMAKEENREVERGKDEQLSSDVTSCPGGLLVTPLHLLSAEPGFS